MGFAALGLPPHAIPRAQDGASPEALVYSKLSKHLVLFALQGVIKMVKRGCRGSPRTRISALPLCQASKYDLNDPNRPCLSICKHRVVGVPDGS